MESPRDKIIGILKLHSDITAIEISKIVYGKHSNQSPFKKKINPVLYELLKENIVIRSNSRPPKWSLKTISVNGRPNKTKSTAPFMMNLPKINPINGSETKPSCHIVVIDLDQRANCIANIGDYDKIIALASSHYNGMIPLNCELIKGKSSMKGEVYNRFILYLGKILANGELKHVNSITVYSNNALYQTLPMILTEYKVNLIIK